LSTSRVKPLPFHSEWEDFLALGNKVRPFHHFFFL
jgi:hypothetical protein